VWADQTSASDGKPGGRLRQRHDARLRIRILPVEKRGVAYGADANTASFVGDLVAERSAFVAVGAEEPEFHELVSAEKSLELGEEFRGESSAAHLQSIVERLAKAAQVGLLSAGEGEFVHQPANDANRRE
jgi:hypothetical protein